MIIGDYIQKYIHDEKYSIAQKKILIEKFIHWFSGRKKGAGKMFF